MNNKKIVTIFFSLAALLTLIFILKGNLTSKDPYDRAVENLIHIDKKETIEKIDNKDSFTLYVGRKSCPYCVEFSEKLEEINDLSDKDIYYLDTEKFTETDGDIMNALNVKYVPSLLKIDKGIPIQMNLELSSDEIVKSLN